MKEGYFKGIGRTIGVTTIMLMVAVPVFAAAPDGAVGPWADTVVSATQGLRKDGSAVLPDRSDSTQALGVAESTGAPTDSPVVPGTFYALGFGGSLTLGFDNALLNNGGNAGQSFEVTGGGYPDEKVKIEASYDGVNWVTVANAIARDGAFGLGSLECADAIRLTDVSDVSLFEPTADGYDVDGVKALTTKEGACNLSVDITKTASVSEIFAGQSVTYTYNVVAADISLTTVVVTDDSCAPVTFVNGDTNSDLWLNPGETWQYTCTTTLNKTTTNIGTVNAKDSFGTGVTDTATATVTVKQNGCTFTQGYWKNHPGAWPALPAPYTQASWLNIFGSPVKGNGWISLAHQYMAATLNILNGANPAAISSIYGDVKNLIDNDPDQKLKPNEVSSYVGKLDAFNQGKIGPGHCKE